MAAFLLCDSLPKSAKLLISQNAVNELCCTLMMEEEELHLYPQPWTFPIEILSHIMVMVAHHGKLQDLRNCMLVCSAWKEATAYGYVWQILFRTKWRWFYSTMCKHVKQKQSPSTSNEPKRRPNKRYKQKSAPQRRFYVGDNILWRKACQERMLKLRGQKEKVRLIRDRIFVYKDIYAFKVSLHLPPHTSLSSSFASLDIRIRRAYCFRNHQVRLGHQFPCNM
jgi:hypothetical protein